MRPRFQLVVLLAVLVAVGVVSVAPAWSQQEDDEEPALPPGLESPDETGETETAEPPALPPGLEPSDDPALPPGLGGDDDEQEAQEAGKPPLLERLPDGLHGFAELRLGPRTQDDPAHTESLTLAEARAQASYDRDFKHVALDARADLILDGVLDEVTTQLRQLQLTFRPAERIDLQLGRQILTWGTGDLLFVNDLFPKDWQSFFIGRDEEYLKAPSDAVRAGWFGDRVNLDVVYTPEFDPDRYIRGERISFWDPATGAPRGDAQPLDVILPGDAFDDDEIAARIYGNVGSLEIAAYGYRGFWKSPGGMDPGSGRATFPALDVWGASARGPLGRGIGSAEIGYYDSRDDARGDDPFVNNGELRLLLGYEQELGHELTGGFQYYLEHLLDHERYLATLPAGEPRDRNRLVLTARITKLLRAQTLIPSVFLYYSPSDGDGYLRPRLTWKRSDFQTLELGANVFFGRRQFTFFGQFEDSSNVYAAIRLQH